MKIKIYFIVLVTLLFQFSLFAQNREVLRIATYNILNYPDNYTPRNPSFQLIMQEVNPDILVVQEITSQFGVNTFLSDVLTDEYVAGPFINGPDTDNAIFYKDSLLSLISHTAISTSLRDISQFLLYHKISLDTFYLYSVHLKASDGTSNEQQRLAEVTVLRNVTDNLPAGSNFIVAGDFNIYRSSEPAYQKLIEQSNPGYFTDPLIAGNWHNNPAYSYLHTQSTMTTSHWGGSTGGLDDRFDMILISQTISDSGGVTIVENSYTAYGNDGNHFNKAINDPPFNIITQEIANALNNASDHLPVYADFDFGAATGIENVNQLANDFKLYQNYPNPFNPTTTISFDLPFTTEITLTVYDILGREVKILYKGEAGAGNYTTQFDASGLPGGMYLYRLSSPERSIAKKMLLLK